MKDQYIGDVNDFYKYQLLRISRPAFDSVFVAWMLTEADGKTDGGRIRYLDDPRSRELDPDLFDALNAIVAGGDRRVGAIEESRILKDCGFLSQPMPPASAGRIEYFEDLARRADPASLVFFDPDNGLEVSSVPKNGRGAERYLYWDELALIRDAGASALVYQHFPRVQRQRYLEALLSRMAGEMGEGYAVFAVHSSLVAFLFAVREDRAGQLRKSLEERCAGSAMLAFASL